MSFTGMADAGDDRAEIKSGGDRNSVDQRQKVRMPRMRFGSGVEISPSVQSQRVRAAAIANRSARAGVRTNGDRLAAQQRQQNPMNCGKETDHARQKDGGVLEGHRHGHGGGGGDSRGRRWREHISPCAEGRDRDSAEAKNVKRWQGDMRGERGLGKDIARASHAEPRE